LRHEDRQRRSLQLASCNLGQVELRFAVFGRAVIVEGKIQVAIEGDDSFVNRLGFFKQGASSARAGNIKSDGKIVYKSFFILSPQDVAQSIAPR